MNVTTRAWKGNGVSQPPLYDVLIDGKVIGNEEHSKGRVLKMGKYWLPILDGGPIQANFGVYSSRKDAAEVVASYAGKVQ